MSDQWTGETEDGGNPFSNQAPPTPQKEEDSDQTDEAPEETGDEEEEIEEVVEEVHDHPQPEPYQLGGEDSGIDQFIQPGEFQFLPTLGYDTARNLSAAKDPDHEETWEELLQVDGKDLLWWTDDSIIAQHPFILVNPSVVGSYAEKAGLSPLETFKLDPGNMFIFGDSGGYQVVSNEDSAVVDDPDKHDFGSHTLHPESVVDWQVANCNCGPILDMPPYEMGGTSQFSSASWSYEEWVEQMFEPRLQKTKENARRQWDYLQTLDADHYKMLGVVHGQTAMNGDEPWELLERWYNEISSVGDFDGWALSPKPSTSLGQIALYLGFANEFMDEADYIHVLQVGAFVQKTLINYYAAIQDEHFVTSDASTFSNGGRFRAFFMPHGWGQRRRIRVTERTNEDGEVEIDDALPIDRYPCRCSVCQTVGEEHGAGILTDEESNSFVTSTMNTHNLEMMLQDDYIIDSLVNAMGKELTDGITVGKSGVKDTSNVFWKMMTDAVQEHMIVQLAYAMMFVREVVENDLETAMEDFHIPWSYNQSTENQSWTIQRASSALQSNW